MQMNFGASHGDQLQQFYLSNFNSLTLWHIPINFILSFIYLNLKQNFFRELLFFITTWLNKSKVVLLNSKLPPLR